MRMLGSDRLITTRHSLDKRNVVIIAPGLIFAQPQAREHCTVRKGAKAGASERNGVVA